jgi:hypothetical protein
MRKNGEFLVVLGCLTTIGRCLHALASSLSRQDDAIWRKQERGKDLGGEAAQILSPLSQQDKPLSCRPEHSGVETSAADR